MTDWFIVNDIAEWDTPALVFYPERIRKNIALAIEMIDDVNRLRPHVKTNKTAEVCRLMLDAGITRFKCATIAEAEMLGLINAPDVLLAYQPVGPKMMRLINLIKTYPQTLFSCLIDNAETAQQLAHLCEENSVSVLVFIDINVGMNRSGIHPENVLQLTIAIKQLKAIHLAGFHAYDGQIHDSDPSLRKQKSDSVFAEAETIIQQVASLFNYPLTLVAGGTPTFPVHAKKTNVECSPGTFVFSDWGYKHLLPDEPFVYAALVVSRVISVIDEETICIDLGHKSVAAENPLPRVHFLNAPDAIPVSQSEEHMVLKIPPENNYKIGDVFYGVPVHICPTVALYDVAYVAENNRIMDSWKVIARSRSITI